MLVAIDEPNADYPLVRIIAGGKLLVLTLAEARELLRQLTDELKKVKTDV